MSMHDFDNQNCNGAVSHSSPAPSQNVTKNIAAHTPQNTTAGATPKRPRALALMSGGLDSMLAVRMIQEQGCEVTGVNFYTTFTGDHDYQFKRDGSGADHSARQAAQELGIELRIIDVTIPFQTIMRSPRYGFGSAANPCLDCKLFFVQEAYRLMQEGGWDFLITGEVVGQRPMSQRIDTLPLAIPVANDRIVRPLSAKLLPESYPERMGWLDRNKLGAISGRGRSEQLALAKAYNFSRIPQPAGGCLLTDPGFGRRMKDFLQRFSDKSYCPDQLRLLRIGRHLNISDTLKLIVGHNQWENQWLQQNPEVHFWAQARDYPGATVVIQAGRDLAANAPLTLSTEEKQLVTEITLHFSKFKDACSTDEQAVSDDLNHNATDACKRTPGVVAIYERDKIIKQLTGWRTINIEQLTGYYL